MADHDLHRHDGTGFSVPDIPYRSWKAEDEAGGAMAPLIFNAWYVIALRKDVGRTLGSIKVLGEPLVHFRTEDGSPVVLDDRCAHRRFPLSKGRLVGDRIACGYHGFTYAASGQCLWAPGVPLDRRDNSSLPFGVRSYPCAERGPWLWAWMGQPELADPAQIPLPAMDNPHAVCGYKMNPANYMMLIENLLDLSHLHFLHDAASLEHAAVVPDDAPAPADGVAWKKCVERTEAGIIVAMCGDNPKRLVRQEDEVIQFGPSLTYGTQRREALPGDSLPPVRPALLQIAHALTPMDHRNTHQFFMLAINSPFTISEREALAQVEDVVFEQDVQAVRDMQAYIDEDVRPGRVEFSMAGDRFGMKMRQILARMKARESSPA